MNSDKSKTYNYIHIDGDVLDFEDGLESVLKLKGERNDYTMWLIIKTLMQGNIPVISTGGGALFSYGRKKSFLLRERISQTLGIDINIILMIPDNKVDNLYNYNKELHNIKNAYNENTELVKNAVIERINRGEWDIPDNIFPKKGNMTIEEMRADKDMLKSAARNFANKISSVSRKNLDFAELLIEEVDHIIVYPRFRTDNYLELKSKVLSYEIFDDKTVPPRDIPDQGKFMQYRILVKKPDNIFHHITIAFDYDREINLGLQNFIRTTELIGDKVKEGDYTILENEQGYKCEFIIIIGIDNIVTDNAAHITINPGSHAPSLMRDLTSAIRKGMSEITIKDNKEKDVTYNLTNRKTYKVNIELSKIFAI